MHPQTITLATWITLVTQARRPLSKHVLRLHPEESRDRATSYTTPLGLAQFGGAGECGIPTYALGDDDVDPAQQRGGEGRAGLRR
jgi:hypothetical protein